MIVLITAGSSAATVNLRGASIKKATQRPDCLAATTGRQWCTSCTARPFRTDQMTRIEAVPAAQIGGSGASIGRAACYDA